MYKKRHYIKSVQTPDQPVVVLLHGFLSSKSYWRGIIYRLSRSKVDVVAIDLLGFGKAPKPKDVHYTYDDHIAHIETSLQELGIAHRKLILVGHSMGALLATRYSILHPQAVQKLILLNPPLYDKPEQASRVLRSTGVIYRILLYSRIRHILWIVLRNISPISKHTRHSREESFRNVIVLSQFFNDLMRISHATTLVVGTRDRKVYLENLSRINLKPNIRLIKLNSGHHAPRTRSAIITKLIVD